jgi:hypothetical protein
MDHLVCLDAGARELETLIEGNKSMILRGSDEINVPHGSVNEGDILYFIDGSYERVVRARAVVSSVFNSGRLSVEESFETIIRNQDKLQLPDKLFETFAGKKYLVLIGVDKIETIEPFIVDTTPLNESDDWVALIDIKLAANVSHLIKPDKHLSVRIP